MVAADSSNDVLPVTHNAPIIDFSGSLTVTCEVRYFCDVFSYGFITARYCKTLLITRCFCVLKVTPSQFLDLTFWPRVASSVYKKKNPNRWLRFPFPNYSDVRSENSLIGRKTIRRVSFYNLVKFKSSLKSFKILLWLPKQVFASAYSKYIHSGRSSWLSEENKTKIAFRIITNVALHFSPITQKTRFSRHHLS